MSFFPGVASIAWPLMLGALTLLGLYGPDRRRIAPKLCGAWLGWWLLFCLLLLPVNLAREIALGFDDGRRIFSHTNIDLSERSMWVMVGEFIAFGGLLGLIWARWRAAVPSRDENLGCDWQEVVKAALDQQRAIEASEASQRWMYASLLIMAAFLPATFCYWRLVGVMGDARYLPPAVMTHMLWLATVYVVTRPLGNALWEQHRRRIRAVSMLAQAHFLSFGPGEQQPPQLEELRAALEQLQPVLPLSLILALVASVASQAAPLVQLFK